MAITTLHTFLRASILWYTAARTSFFPNCLTFITFLHSAKKNYNYKLINSIHNLDRYIS